MEEVVGGGWHEKSSIRFGDCWRHGAGLCASGRGMVVARSGRLRGLRCERRKRTPRPRRTRTSGSRRARPNLPAGASPAVAIPITTSCRTGISTSRVRTRRRKSRNASMSNMLPTSRTSGVASSRRRFFRNSSRSSRPPWNHDWRQDRLRGHPADDTAESGCKARDPASAPAPEDDRALQGRIFIVVQLAAIVVRRTRSQEKPVRLVLSQGCAQLAHDKRQLFQVLRRNVAGTVAAPAR